MQGEIVVEVDGLTDRHGHRARDWTELFVSRQIRQPLYFESDEGLASSGIDALDRLDSNSWRLTFTTQSHFTSTDLASQLIDGRREGAALASVARFIRSVRAISPRSCIVTTVVPIGDLSTLLSCPALGISTDIPSDSGLRAPETLTTHSGIAVRFRPVSPDAPRTSAPDVSTIFDGSSVQRAFPEAEYRLSTRGVDLVACLRLPSIYPPSLRNDVAAAITVSRPDWHVNFGMPAASLALPSALPSVDGLDPARGTTPQTAAGQRLADTATAIEFANYYPNMQITALAAAALSPVMGRTPTSRSINYGDLLGFEQKPTNSENAQLVILAPACTHPAALLLSSQGAPVASKEAADQYRAELLASYAASTRQDSVRHALAASNLSQANAPFLIPLLSLRAAIATRPDVLLPPIPASGWFDVRSLNRQ
jgi:hypothetical protein